jgi:hypothetical protein
MHSLNFFCSNLENISCCFEEIFKEKLLQLLKSIALTHFQRKLANNSAYNFLDHFDQEEEIDCDHIKLLGVFFCTKWNIAERKKFLTVL